MNSEAQAPGAGGAEQPESAEAADKRAGAGAGAGAMDPRVWRVAAVVWVAPFMTQLDSTVVNLSLATIGERLGAAIGAAQWVVSGYLLALALALPLNGWLVDRLGPKRLYLVCFSAFTLASLLCGWAGSMGALVAARVLQGLAGGILAPMTQMMIARFAGRHMARVMGYTVVPILIAPIVGPVLAGVVLQHLDWPWLFYLNLPVGLVAVAMAAWLLPADEAVAERRPLDLLGVLLLSPGLALLLYGFQHALERSGAICLGAGALLAAFFVRHALRKGRLALIDLSLFDNRVFSTAAATQLLSNGMFYARQFLVPLFLIVGCGVAASQAGWVMAGMGVGMMCSFPLMGLLTERFGCRAVACSGASLALAGTLPFLLVSGPFPLAVAVVSLLVAGVGQGMISIPSVSAAYASVPRPQLAVANTAINIVQRVGAPLATTVIASVIPHASTAPAALERPHFTVAFALLAVWHLLTLVSATRLPARVWPTADARSG